MFSKVAIFACLLAVVLSAPAEVVDIVSQNNDIQPDGTFLWSYESSDGTKVEQSGVPKPVDDKEVAEVVKGSVVYNDKDGVKHELTYVADENGFQPQGADIPVAPEVPPQIARALEYIAAHPQLEDE